MKILLVTHTFLPKYIGGTEVYTFELAKELSSKGHEVVILNTDPLSQKRPYELSKVEYMGLNVVTIHKDITKYSSFIQTYLDHQVDSIYQEYLNKFQPDVIHYLHLMHLSVEMVKVASHLGIPQVITLNDFWFQTSFHSRVTSKGLLMEPYSRNIDAQELSLKLNSGPMVYTPLTINNFLLSKNKLKLFLLIIKKITNRVTGRFLYPFTIQNYLNMVDKRAKTMRKTLSQLDTVIFPTVFLFQEFCKWKFQTKRVVIAEHGINIKLFNNFERLLSNKIRFAFIGAIIPSKGLDVLLNAWRKTNTHNSILKVYGNFDLDKKYSKSLEPLLLGQENIILKGSFQPQDIAKVFSEIDVLVLPSRWFENGPLVLRNALLAKTPVIATNLGSNPEFIKHSKNGLLFTNEDVGDLSQKLSYFIENPEQIGIMAKNIPEQKSIHDDSISLLKIYQNLIENKAK